jgi:hypothetical protein
MSVNRTAEQILNDIRSYEPSAGDWRSLDTLLEELWDAGVSQQALPTLFEIFERFPNDDGAGVFWSIVHGVEALDCDYEAVLRESIERQPSEMAKIMLNRLEKSKTG